MLYASKNFRTKEPKKSYPSKVLLGHDQKEESELTMAELTSSIQLRWLLSIITGKTNRLPVSNEHSWRAIQKALAVLAQDLEKATRSERLMATKVSIPSCRSNALSC